MKSSNLEKLREKDVLKIVCKESDFESITGLLATANLKCYVYISPIFGQVQPGKLVRFLQTLRDNGIDTEKYRIQVQLHKIIWNPETRGV